MRPESTTTIPLERMQSMPKITKATVEVDGKPVMAKTLKAFQAMDKGATPEMALILATGNLNPHKNSVHNLKKKYEKWSLHHPKAQKIAGESIQKFAGGEDVNGIKPKASDVLAASMRIIDAEDPVIKRSENINVNVDFLPVNPERYRRG